jgi:hypothetical protein
MEVDEEKMYSVYPNIWVGVCLWFCRLDVGVFTHSPPSQHGSFWDLISVRETGIVMI